MLNDNNISTFGQEAVKAGYYDPIAEKVFTITGHVDMRSYVVSLVALQDRIQMKMHLKIGLQLIKMVIL